MNINVKFLTLKNNTKLKKYLQNKNTKSMNINAKF